MVQIKLTVTALIACIILSATAAPTPKPPGVVTPSNGEKPAGSRFEDGRSGGPGSKPGDPHPIETRPTGYGKRIPPKDQRVYRREPRGNQDHHQGSSHHQQTHPQDRLLQHPKPTYLPPGSGLVLNDQKVLQPTHLHHQKTPQPTYLQKDLAPSYLPQGSGPSLFLDHRGSSIRQPTPHPNEILLKNPHLQLHPENQQVNLHQPISSNVGSAYRRNLVRELVERIDAREPGRSGGEAVQYRRELVTDSGDINAREPSTDPKPPSVWPKNDNYKVMRKPKGWTN